MRIGWLEDTMETREALAGIARGVELTAVGCPFFNRCPAAVEGTCDKYAPPERNDGEGHVIACHLSIEELNEYGDQPQEILHGYEKVDPADKPGAHV